MVSIMLKTAYASLLRRVFTFGFQFPFDLRNVNKVVVLCKTKIYH
jgi:hypothetical protein